MAEATAPKNQGFKAPRSKREKMKSKATFLFLATAVLFLTTILGRVGAQTEASSALLPGYPIEPRGDSFDEDFDEDSLNEDLFEVKDNMHLWNSWLSGEKVEVREGVLRLQSEAGDTHADLIKVGGVVTQAFYGHGHLMFRARTNPTRGMAGSVYLYNEDKDRDEGGHHEEIDIELSAKFPGLASLVTFHDDDWQNDEKQNAMHRGGLKNIREVPGLESFDSREFNTYVIDWQPGKLTWSINGIQVERFQDAVPTTPMNIHLDTHHNAEWDAFMDSEPEGSGAFEIDSIRYEPYEA